MYFSPNYSIAVQNRREGVHRLSVRALYTARETVLQNKRGVRVILGPVQLLTTHSKPQPSKCAIHAVLPRHSYDTAAYYQYPPNKVYNAR